MARGDSRTGPIIDMEKQSKSNWAKYSQASIYRADYHPMKMVEFMTLGWSLASVACEFEVSKSTLTVWATKYPDFAEARKIGTEARESHYDKAGIEAMAGDNPGFNSVVWKTVSSTFGIREEFDFNQKIKIDFVGAGEELEEEDDAPAD